MTEFDEALDQLGNALENLQGRMAADGPRRRRCRLSVLKVGQLERDGIVGGAADAARLTALAERVDGVQAEEKEEFDRVLLRVEAVLSSLG